MTGKYGIGAVVLGKWRIERKIGEGSFGTVYEIRREEFGQAYTAALKVIILLTAFRTPLPPNRDLS